MSISNKHPFQTDLDTPALNVWKLISPTSPSPFTAHPMHEKNTTN